MLFDLKDFRKDLLDREPELLRSYEALHGKLSGKIQKQYWYKAFCAPLAHVCRPYAVPPELADDFDWDLLLLLMAASLSCDCYFVGPLKICPQPDDIPNLRVAVFMQDENGGLKQIIKSVEELWGFQILRLFEIYVEELMGLAVVEADADERAALKAEIGKRFEALRDGVRYLAPEAEQQWVEERRRNLLPDEEIIYHYTTWQTFMSIIEGGTLRMVDKRFQNDRGEHDFQIAAVTATKDRMGRYQDYAEHGDYIEGVLERARSLLEMDAYITCFSTDGDLLSQWRAYAEGAIGVAIGFDKKKLVEMFGALPDEDRFFLNRMDYDQPGLQDKIVRYLEKMARERPNKDVGEILFATLLGLKHSGFAEEREIRLQYVPGWKPEMGPTRQREYFERTNSYSQPMRIYYYAVQFDRLPVKVVRIGPGAPEANINAAKAFLRDKGYGDVEVAKSVTPFVR